MSTSISSPNLFVNYNDTTKLYNLTDNAADAAVASGAPSTGKTEDEINKTLAPLGLKMVKGQMESVDGFTVNTQNATPVVGGQAVSLPPVLGDTASPAAVADKVNYMASMPGGSEGALMWLELSTLAKGAMQDIDMANKLKIAFQQSAIDAKDSEITAKYAEIKDMQSSANTKLVTAICMAVVEAALTMFGGAKLGALSGVAGGVVQAVGNKIDTDTAQTNQKKDEILGIVAQKKAEMSQMLIDEAQTSKDKAIDLLKLALKIISDHYENMTQAIQAITRG